MITEGGLDKTRDKMTIIMQIGRGLEFIHSRGLVHRDLCPKNILLTSDGRLPNAALRKQHKRPKIYEVMQSKSDGLTESQTWNRRYREYMDKIKTGSLYDVAEVYRDLSLLKLTKDLSFGERKLYDTAQVLLVRELSTARDTDDVTIISELEAFFVVEPPEEAEPEVSPQPSDG